MKQQIELELRAEVHTRHCEGLEKKLSALGTFHSATDRLSVMHFGEIDGKETDIRVRTTNGKCEIVIKTGRFGSHDRKETSQPIEPSQFTGMVRFLSQLCFQTKVGERSTKNYTLPGNVLASLVSAGPIAYLELESLVSETEVEKKKQQLEEIAETLGVDLLDSEAQFLKLCQRLSEAVDWDFHGSKADYEKLSLLLEKHFTRTP